MRKTRKFFVSIPPINGVDPKISAYCKVNYKEPSLCIKVGKKKHAQLIEQHMDQVLDGTATKGFQDGLKKMLYLQEHLTMTLARKTIVKVRFLISPFGYESK